MQNSITKYSLTREDIKGTDTEPDAFYDLIDVVIVRRGGDPELNTIFDYVDAVYHNDVERSQLPRT